MSYTILINKADEKIEVEFDSFPEHVKRYIIEYGIKQRLNDCHSQVAKDDPNCRALVLEQVTRVLDDWQAGAIRTMRTSTGQTQLEKVVHKIFLRSLFGMKAGGQVVKTMKAAQHVLDKLAEQKFNGDSANATAFLMAKLAEAQGIKPETLEARMIKAAEKELAPVDNITFDIEL